MTTSGVHARMIMWQQRQCDADIRAFTQSVFWVMQAESQSDQRGHGCQGDVSLIKGQRHAQGLFAFVSAFTNNPDIPHRSRV